MLSGGAPHGLFSWPARRSVVQAMTLGAPFVLSRLSRAAPARKVHLALAGSLDPAAAPAIVAKAKGYWAEVGLEVQISTNQGSAAAAQAVAAGRFDFALAAASAAILQTIQDQPVVSLACIGYDATMTIAVQADSPVRSPSDLAGKSLGGALASDEVPFLPAFALASGLDLHQVRPVTLPTDALLQYLLDRQVDAIRGLALSLAPSSLADNHPLRFLPFRNAGLGFYGNVLLTRPEILRNQATECEGMAQGLARAAKLCLLRPAEAVSLITKQASGAPSSPAEARSVALGLDLLRMTMTHQAAMTGGVGWSDGNDYAAMTDQALRCLGNGASRRPDPATLFTNQCVGDVTLTSGEWTEVEAQVKRYRDVVGSG